MKANSGAVSSTELALKCLILEMSMLETTVMACKTAKESLPNLMELFTQALLLEVSSTEKVLGP